MTDLFNAFTPTTAAGVDAVRASIECGMRHVEAEKTNSLEGIMGTIDPDPYFPLLDHDGQGGLTLQFLTDFESVRGYYGARHGSYEIVDSRHVAAIATELYSFRESVATLRGVGEIGGSDGTGKIFQVNSVVLFPTGPAGIGGEIVWTRYPFGQIVSDSVTPDDAVAGPVHLPNARIRNAEHYDAYLDAWRAGDHAGMVDHLTDDARWLRRTRRGGATSLMSTNGCDETAQQLAVDVSAWQPVRIDVLNRLVGEWYVFADLSLEMRSVESGDIERRRHFALHPIGADGRLRAELGDSLVLV